SHGDFHQAFGRSSRDLVAEWNAFLESIPLGPRELNRAYSRFHGQSLFSRPCAREVARLGRKAQLLVEGSPERALELFQRCAKLQPQESWFRLQMATLLDHLGRAAEAAQVLKKLHDDLGDK